MPLVDLLRNLCNPLAPDCEIEEMFDSYGVDLEAICVEHGLSGMLVSKYRDRMPERMSVLKSIWFENLRRATYAYEVELPSIVAVLESSAVPHVFMKGVVTSRTLYSDSGAREFKDIDILVQSGSTRPLKVELASSGYREGRFSLSGTFLEPTAEVRKMYEHYLHELHPIVNTRKSPEAPVLSLDLKFGLFPGSGDYINIVLERRQSRNISGISIHVASPEDSFIMMCLNIWKDNSDLVQIYISNGLKLYQFADLCALLTDSAPIFDRDYIGSTIRAYNLYRPVGYCAKVVLNELGLSSDFLSSCIEVCEERGPIDIDAIDFAGIRQDRWLVPFWGRFLSMNKQELIGRMASGPLMSKLEKIRLGITAYMEDK